jgi:hypothetical protein
MKATQGRRATGTSGADRGVCPVCRGPVRLRVADGKVMRHGVNAATPRGCAGHGEAPYRVKKQPARDPSPIRPAVSFDAAAPPDLGIEVLVERRDDPDAPVRVRSSRPAPDDAA